MIAVYRCQSCNKVSPPGQPSYSLVVETRKKVYPPRERANPERRKQKKRADRYAKDPGGVGWEIVREIRVCRTCHEAAAAILESPEEQADVQPAAAAD